jgi:hypothetical protein
MQSTSTLRRAGTKLRLLTITGCAVLAATVGTAQAEITYQGSFGSSGTTQGKFSRPAGVAVNNATGDVYVVDRNQNRVQQFTAAGAFVRMWGFGVVKSGSSNIPHHEVQTVSVRATDGTFALKFGANTTPSIPFNATSGEVEAALNALPSISAGGGSVSVTGGPGDPVGSTPYVVTFSGGPLGDTDVAGLTIESQGIGYAVGTELTCTGGPGSATTKEFQWLRNGIAIAGATASTYTTTPADEGTLVQCQFFAINSNTGATQVSSRAVLVSPAGGTTPPIPPASIAVPGQSGVINVPGPAPARTLTCNPGTWQGAPTFTYQWYRDGVSIPGATEAEYEVSEGSLIAPASYQCAVTGANAAGSVTVVSGNRTTSPAPSPAVPVATSVLSLPASVTSTVVTTDFAGEVFEVCQVSPPSTDVCQAGRSGSATGQFNAPRGIAVDNSPGGSGDVYVVDDNNFRVQKVSATGTPILMFGKDVNQTTGGDLCTVASGDKCGAGLENADAIPGQFGSWPATGGFAELGEEVAVDPAGDVYVGDVRGGGAEDARIQRFDSAGVFSGQVRIPGGNPSPSFFARPISVGVDSEGRVFASLSDGAIEIFDQSELGPEDVGPAFGERKVIWENNLPRQIAIGPNDDKVWISDANLGKRHVCGESGTARRAIAALDASGRRLDCTAPIGEGELPEVTGLAISKTGTAYVAVGSQNKVKTFKLPEPQPPVVVSQSVRSITTASARLRAEIDPGFESTSYVFASTGRRTAKRIHAPLSKARGN